MHIKYYTFSEMDKLKEYFRQNVIFALWVDNRTTNKEFSQEKINKLSEIDKYLHQRFENFFLSEILCIYVNQITMSIDLFIKMQKNA